MSDITFVFFDGAELVLNHEELLIILETARVALDDVYMFDMIGDNLDVSDEYMKEIQEKLNTALGIIEGNVVKGVGEIARVAIKEAENA